MCSDIPLLTPTARSSVKAPPPNMKPTPALRIDGFMRPFNLQQAGLGMHHLFASLTCCKYPMVLGGVHCIGLSCCSGIVTQVKALLSQEGAIIREEKGFWLSSIKTHCYVIYETAEQAEAIR